MSATKAAAAPASGIRSLVPAGIDRLGWSRFHTRMVVALGVAWILDGLEVSIAGNVSPYLTDPGALGLGSGSVAFSVGAVYPLGEVLGLVVLFVRRHLPESPRWLVMHGRVDEAEEAVGRIERDALAGGGLLDPIDESRQIEIRPAGRVGYRELTKTLFQRYPSRAVLGTTLMITQSFLYNAIFFTYSLVLTKIYGVPEGDTAYYFMAFAVGNLCGPLGHLFDTVGRRAMIGTTYLVAGVALAVSAFLFHAGALTALTQTVWWCFIFFFASAGASAAYLTVGGILPLTAVDRPGEPSGEPADPTGALRAPAA